MYFFRVHNTVFSKQKRIMCQEVREREGGRERGKGERRKTIMEKETVLDDARKHKEHFMLINYELNFVVDASKVGGKMF